MEKQIPEKKKKTGKINLAIPSFLKENPYKGIDSFGITGKARMLIGTTMNIHDCNGFSLPVSLKGFKCSLYINMTSNIKGVPYALTIYALGKMKELDFNDIVNEKMDKKTNTVVIFFKQNRSIKLEFKYKYDFQTTKRILRDREIFSRLRENPVFDTLEDANPLDRVPIRRDMINNYGSFGGSSSESRTKSSVFKSFSSATSTTASGSGNSEQQSFYLLLINTPPSQWKMTNIYEWFKQIPIINKGNLKLCTLFTYIQEKNLKLDFDDFLREEGGPFIRLQKAVFGIHEKRKFNKKYISPHSFLPRAIVDRLLMHFRILNYFGNVYKPTFYVVLKKKLVHFTQSEAVQRNIGRFEIKKVEEKILFVDDYLWSLKSLKRKLFFCFLFGMSLEEYISNLEKEYDRFHDEEQFGEDGKVFFSNRMESLELFNQKIGIPLERISLKIFLEKNYWKAGLDWKHCRAELFKKQTRLDNLELEIGKKYEDKFALFENKMKDPSKNEKEKGGYQRTLLLLKKKMEGEIVRERNQLMKELEVLRNKRTTCAEIYKDVKPTKEKESEEKWRFYGEYGEIRTDYSLSSIKKKKSLIKCFNNEEELEGEEEEELEELEDEDPMLLSYHQLVQRLIEKKLEAVQEEFNEMENRKSWFSLCSKLVLSRRVGKNIPFLPRYTMRVVQSLLDFEFFKFGFIHGYVILCNMGFHWSSSQLVYIADIKNMSSAMLIYEDLSCLDTQSRVFPSWDALDNYISEIARLIIDWNSNFTYSFAGIRALQNKDVGNCQEFCIQLLKKFNVPNKFYPKVDDYLESLGMLEHKKLKVKKKKKGGKKGEEIVVEIDSFRFMKVTSDLPEIVKQEVCGGKEKVYFPTHRSLDIFVRKLLEKCPEFVVLFPGVYFLLKGFDRAFWLQKIYRVSKENGAFEPLMKGKKCDCPFYHDPDQLSLVESGKKK